MSHTGIGTGVSVLVTCAYFVIPSSWLFNQQMCQPEQLLAKRLIGEQVQVCLLSSTSFISTCTQKVI